MLSLLRIINADQDDLNQLTQIPGSSFRSLRDASLPLNSKNEMKAMTFLKDLVQDYLDRYPTSLEEDIRRLAVKGPGSLIQFSNERHAAIQVKGEKDVLLFLKDFAETTLKILYLLHNDAVQFESALEEVVQKKHAVISSHCRTILRRLRREESANSNAANNKR